MMFIIVIPIFGSLIGMIIDRNPSSKSFLCYETFFSTIPAIMPLRPCEINEMILVSFLLRNSTFEVVLGLSVSFLTPLYATLIVGLN